MPGIVSINAVVLWSETEPGIRFRMFEQVLQLGRATVMLVQVCVLQCYVGHRDVDLRYNQDKSALLVCSR